MPDPTPRTVLVIGATGYIGGRLVPELLAAGHHVRCLARTPAKLDAETWRADVEVVTGDVLDPESLPPAFAGTEVVYYLVHSIGAPGAGDFASRDRVAAGHVRTAATDAAVEQIVYLGGLGDAATDELSPHLASRHEVGHELAAGPVPVTELRAAVIIGSGSASFEMLRHLVEVLPAMVTPRWVGTRCQPIAIRDVLVYLVGVLGQERALGRVLEIGGADVVTYRQMMDTYAEIAGLRRRLVVPVPVLSPRLSSLWVGLVTPLPADLARPLVDSLVNEVVVHDDAIREIVPHTVLPCRAAIEHALRRVADLDVATTWANAELRGRTPADPMPSDPEWAGGTVLTDARWVAVAAAPAEVYAAVCGIGGARGWFVAGWAWRARGLLDQVVGGIGMRRGRRHPDELRVGDPVDFWRVEALERDALVRLRAEMRLPGDAWLEWRIRPTAAGSSLEQRARFHPRGLLGRLYWYALTPIHGIIFSGLARALGRAAEARPPRGAPTATAAAAAPPLSPR